MDTITALKKLATAKVDPASFASNYKKKWVKVKGTDKKEKTEECADESCKTAGCGGAKKVIKPKINSKDVVKKAMQLTKLSAAQRAVYKNRTGLKKLATWVIKNPSMVKTLQVKSAQFNKIMIKKANIEPKFTLNQSLKIIGALAGSIYKAAQEKKAAEQAEVDRFVNIMTLAAEKLKKNS